jgi:hypothetical protein
VDIALDDVARLAKDHCMRAAWQDGPWWGYNWHGVPCVSQFVCTLAALNPCLGGTSELIMQALKLAC